VTGPDAVAAVLLTGRAIQVEQAFRLHPVGTARGLTRVLLGGTVPVDPAHDDLFRVMIEERKRVHSRPGLSDHDKARVDAFLKVNANSGSYGIFAEMNRQELPKGKQERVTVFGADALFDCDCHAPEEPGAFCFPPHAALITGGARLMLAMLERCVTDLHGVSAICDTDSAAIVATRQGGVVPCFGGPYRTADGRSGIYALSWAEVDDIVRRFERLNPYAQEAVPGSVLKIEDVNYPCDARGKRLRGSQRRDLFCLAISAKRYCLFTVADDGAISIEKASESGLGVLLNPREPESETSRGEHVWVRDLWQVYVARALGRTDVAWPTWADLPVVTKLAITKPKLLDPFSAYNAGKPYADQIKPGNFILSAQVSPMDRPSGLGSSRFHLIAPFDTDPSHWLSLPWVDRYSGTRYRVRVGAPSGVVMSDTVYLKSYREVFEEYEMHPEYKSDAADGTPCTKSTVGLLLRTHAQPLGVAVVGKEANGLEDVEAGLVHEWDEVRNVYRNIDHTQTIERLLARHSRSDVARMIGVSPSTVSRWRAGRQRARPRAVVRVGRFS